MREPGFVARSVWLSPEVDALVEAEKSRLEARRPGQRVTYSDAIRSLLVAGSAARFEQVALTELAERDAQT